ncbi:MAG: DUF4234 domain-containing protein [Sandaracinaceae bacterium]
MIKRSPVLVVFLSLVTFGLYGYYWLYKTSDELRAETGRKDISPRLDLLLTILTFGIYGIYAAARNAKIAHEELELRGQPHEDHSLAVAGIAALSVISGYAWVIALAIAQHDFNALADADPRFAPARAYEEAPAATVPARKARVDVEPLRSPVGSAWAEAEVEVESRGPRSSADFRSDAPMPNVF